jgi:hypothetical protein
VKVAAIVPPAIVLALLVGCTGKPKTDSSADAHDHQLFLTLSREGAIVVRSLDGKQNKTVARGPFNEAVLDPDLDLVWARRNDRLEVIDLRENESGVRLIATGIPPGTKWSILRHLGAEFHVIAPASVCEQEHEVALSWDQPSRISDLGAGSGAVISATIVDGGWLDQEYGRRVNRSAARADYSAPTLPRIPLPELRADCDEPDDCGRYVPFGGSGLRLVMIQSRSGADCVHYACLAQDSATGQFATPPALKSWGMADQAVPGPCGPYRFDLTQRFLLYGDLVCTLAGHCEQVDGQTLGWRRPGPTVGTEG